MEVTKLNSEMSALRKQLVVSSLVGAAVVNTVVAAQKSLDFLLMLTGSLLNAVDGLPDWTERRFPMDELHRMEKPGPENKDGSDTEDDDEDDDEDADADDQDDDDDAGDEDFSGGEEDGDDEGDPEEDPEANGNEGSDDDDDDDGDDGEGDDDEDGDDDDEDEEEDKDEEDQPPAKKRK